MPIIVREPETQFTPAPAGVHHAVCCDVVNLGPVESQWGIKNMVRITWQIEEEMPDGRRFSAGKRYTASLHEKSNLRADLESWRGKRLTEAELAGFDLERLIGVNALLNILQEENNGKMYSNIKAIMPPPRTAPKLTVTADFVRKADRENSSEGTSVSDPESNSGPDDWDTREPGEDLEEDMDEDPFGGALG